MSKRILTVDDSRTMREMVAMTLRNAGFHVIQADDGVNALKVLADNEVDVIITAQHAQHGRPGACQGPARADATGWITKPFDPQRLLQVVNEVCQ
jgi:two-component system chemotaxis response regulator CheY